MSVHVPRRWLLGGRGALGAGGACAPAERGGDGWAMGATCTRVAWHTGTLCTALPVCVRSPHETSLQLGFHGVAPRARGWACGAPARLCRCAFEAFVGS
eukprot:7377290-Prymnesium_polylepis.1